MYHFYHLFYKTAYCIANHVRRKIQNRSTRSWKTTSFYYDLMKYFAVWTDAARNPLCYIDSRFNSKQICSANTVDKVLNPSAAKYRTNWQWKTYSIRLNIHKTNAAVLLYKFKLYISWVAFKFVWEVCSYWILRVDANRNVHTIFFYLLVLFVLFISPLPRFCLNMWSAFKSWTCFLCLSSLLASFA